MQNNSNSHFGCNSVKPRITVVVPCLTQTKHLEMCLYSILSQNYSNLELMVMDCGSTDDNLAVLKKYEQSITYWRCCPDDLLLKAAEEGLRRSTGQIMTWLNPDCVLFPHSLEIVSAVFTSRPDVDWLIGRSVMMNEHGEVRDDLKTLPLWSRAHYLNKKYRNPSIQQAGVFWRRTIWIKSGESIKSHLPHTGDLELWTRFFRHGELYSVDAALAGQRETCNRSSSEEKIYRQEAEAVLEEEQKEYLLHPNKPSLSPPPNPILKEQVSWCLYNQIRGLQMDVHSQYLRYEIEEMVSQCLASCPILIYQMGKVGSSTVRQTLLSQETCGPVINTHALSWQGFELRLKHCNEPQQYMYDRWRKRRIIFERTRGKVRWKVITLVRDLVGREISAFFESMRTILPDVFFDRIGQEEALRSIYQHLQSRMLNFDESAFASSWFDQEFKRSLGVDIFQAPFDKTKGYQIYQTEEVDILCIRLEDLSVCYRQAFQEFLGIEIPELKYDNVGECRKRKYTAYYRPICGSFKLSELILRRIYSTRLMRHFYRPDQIEQFKERWLGSGQSQQTDISRELVQHDRQEQRLDGLITIN